VSPLERRAFLRSLAAASAGCVLAPGALLAGAGASPESDVRWHPAPCRFCSVGCGLLVGVRDGRALAVKPDPESPVNGGLACAIGYHAVHALHGADRLTAARVGRGPQQRASTMAAALDVVAVRLAQTIRDHGKDSVALFGSGHWTIPDAYVAAKLWKGGLGSNQVDTDARLWSGAAAAGLRTSFGLDGAPGCYDDIEHADTFILWDCNLAETGSVLFSRMLERRRRNPAVRIIDLSTRTTRTSYAADRSLVYAPGSEAALANALAHEIVSRGRVERAFVERHVAFRRGETDIGYGRVGDGLVEDTAHEASWGDYVRFLQGYRSEDVARLSGLAVDEIRWLASLYADRSRKVLTVWDEQLNRSARGTWVNNLLYNIHLLVGKVATPGDNALCVTGQPACSAALHAAGAAPDALPHGSVTDAAARGRATRIWGVRPDVLDPRPGRHAIALFRAFERGEIRFLWIQASNPLASLPDLDRFRRAAMQGDRFLVVSDAYPTATTAAANVVLPTALWFEQAGVYGTGERRLQPFGQLVPPPGEALGLAWQTIEVARRLGRGALFPWAARDHCDAIWAEYARFHDDPARRVPTLPTLHAAAGLRWPFVEGRETAWRYNTRFDPAADPQRGGFHFYGHADGRARIWLRPQQPPAETPDESYPFRLSTGRVLEHSETGVLTRRVPALQRAVPRAYVEINADDARTLGIRNGEQVRLRSRRGALVLEARIDYRAQPQRGHVFVPTFDESVPVHALAGDTYCPLSGQPDFAPAVRIERVARGGAG
jgi:nitrate reductase (cytochrome)